MAKRFYFILLILLPFEMVAQHFDWKRYISWTQSGIRNNFDLYKDNLIFGSGEFYTNDSLHSGDTHLFIDTAGLIVKKYNILYTDSQPAVIYKNQNNRYVGYFEKTSILSYTGDFTRMVLFNEYLTSYRKVFFSDINSHTLFGGNRSYFRFKNKHIFTLGKRGNPNFFNTVKSYWMKMDTALNIIDQKEKDYFVFDNPSSACWSSSGKMVSFCHGIYYYDEDSVSFSSFTTDTAGNFSPRKKHLMPGINRKHTTDSWPQLSISELPSKDFLISATYDKNGAAHRFSFFAVFDSSFSTMKKFKRIQRRQYYDVLPLIDGRFTAIEWEWNALNYPGGIVGYNFVVLDTGFNIVFKHRVERTALHTYRINKYLFFNTRDVMLSHCSNDSLFFNRINNVGEPYIVDPYPPDSSFYLSKSPDLQRSTQFALYPNPGDGLIWVQNVASGCHLSVFNQLGKCIVEEKQYTGPFINIQNYQRGIYHIRLEKAGKISNFRYLKE